MDQSLALSFDMWDRQELRRLEVIMERKMREWEQEQAYIQLNNLYLWLQSGKLKMDKGNHRELRFLVTQAYDAGDDMIEWWHEEFKKLEGWYDF